MSKLLKHLSRNHLDEITSVGVTSTDTGDSNMSVFSEIAIKILLALLAVAIVVCIGFGIKTYFDSKKASELLAENLSKDLVIDQVTKTIEIKDKFSDIQNIHTNEAMKIIVTKNSNNNELNDIINNLNTNISTNKVNNTSNSNSINTPTKITNTQTTVSVSSKTTTKKEDTLKVEVETLHDSNISKPATTILPISDLDYKIMALTQMSNLLDNEIRELPVV